jgi:Flp pilus assembly pilin Flp
MLRRFILDQSAATAIEYALLGTIIAVGLAATFALLGDSVLDVFSIGTGGPGDAIAAAANSL